MPARSRPRASGSHPQIVPPSWLAITAAVAPDPMVTIGPPRAATFTMCVSAAGLTQLSTPGAAVAAMSRAVDGVVDGDSLPPPHPAARTATAARANGRPLTPHGGYAAGS